MQFIALIVLLFGMTMGANYRRIKRPSFTRRIGATDTKVLSVESVSALFHEVMNEINNSTSFSPFAEDPATLESLRGFYRRKILIDVLEDERIDVQTKLNWINAGDWNVTIAGSLQKGGLMDDWNFDMQN